MVGYWLVSGFERGFLKHTKTECMHDWFLLRDTYYKHTVLHRVHFERHSRQQTFSYKYYYQTSKEKKSLFIIKVPHSLKLKEEKHHSVDITCIPIRVVAFFYSRESGKQKQFSGISAHNDIQFSVFDKLFIYSFIPFTCNGESRFTEFVIPCKTFLIFGIGPIKY